MTDTIRRGKDGRLLLCLESTEGFPALDLAQKKLGTQNVHQIPLQILDAEWLAGDVVIACRQGSAAARNTARLLKTRFPKLPPNGYRVECIKHDGGTALVVVGGDVFGMLAGLSDAFLNGELTRRGFTYRGGSKTEKPAFPLRYYWTWDHSTNWVLDDEGNQLSGCYNQYLKRPETYVEDYRRLVDHCVDMRFNGILIWGFLRDPHGGEAYGYEVAKYAADRGVAIMPGAGTTWYGGIYYEGNHPCNLDTYVAKHPERGMMREDGTYHTQGLSPYHPDNLKFIRDSLEWLYTSFPIGGVNLENGDLLVDHSPAAKRGRKKIKSGEADFYKDQFFAYKDALATIHRIAPEAWNTYATYTGFGLGADVSNAGSSMGREPYFAKRMPESAIAQWTLTGMVSRSPVPLRDWRDAARPKAVYKNPSWPRGLRPPTPRSAGFLHQASQWSWLRRSELALSTFAEGCLRSHEAGLEGLSIHGEVSRRALVWNLNYLAMRHWTYHPVSTLDEFAQAELAPRLGGKKEAREFAEALCLLDEGRLDEAGKISHSHFSRVYPYRSSNPWEISGPGDVTATRMWEQLREWCTLKGRGGTGLHGMQDVL